MSMALFSVFLVLIQSSKYGVPLSTEEQVKPSPQIVGGEEAAEGTAPHMAALVIGEVLTLLVGGATIVSPWYLMTAAHCIGTYVILGKLPPTYRAIVGTNDWHHGGTHARISKFHIHPQWDSQNVKNDVGLLRLEEPLLFTDRVAMIALNYDWVGGGEEAYVTGWGQLQTWNIISPKLQILFVRTLSSEQCASDLGSPVLGCFPHTLQADVEICAFNSSESGMCNGDSGSPLVLTATTPHRQIGIVSWGCACARGVPDVYTRMSGIKDFLIEYLD